MSKILFAKPYKEEKIIQFKKYISCLKEPLTLYIIQIGDDFASNIYIKNKKKILGMLGIKLEHIKYWGDVSQTELINKINELNNDDRATGILLQLPIPEWLDLPHIINTIDVNKDVDGLTDINLGKLFTGDGIVPCVAQGIINLLEYYKIDLDGKKVVIIGRSNLIGMPLMHLCLRHNATVVVCHKHTPKLKSETISADILISAAGQAGLIKSDMVSSNAIVIDVGLDTTRDKIFGDVDLLVHDKVQAYTPVIGGVGIMTIMALVDNLIKCYNLQQEQNIDNIP